MKSAKQETTECIHIKNEIRLHCISESDQPANPTSILQLPDEQEIVSHHNTVIRTSDLRTWNIDKLLDDVVGSNMLQELSIINLDCLD